VNRAEVSAERAFVTDRLPADGGRPRLGLQSLQSVPVLLSGS
jgi:hypothetical protein